MSEREALQEIYGNLMRIAADLAAKRRMNIPENCFEQVDTGLYALALRREIDSLGAALATDALDRRTIEAAAKVAREVWLMAEKRKSYEAQQAALMIEERIRALAQTAPADEQAEPVAYRWRWFERTKGDDAWAYHDYLVDGKRKPRYDMQEVQMLYTHPAPQADKREIAYCVECGDGITAHDPGICGCCYATKYDPEQLAIPAQAAPGAVENKSELADYLPPVDQCYVPERLISVPLGALVNADVQARAGESLREALEEVRGATPLVVEAAISAYDTATRRALRNAKDDDE